MNAWFMRNICGRQSSQRNRKHVPCFRYRVRNTSGSLGEREMLWEHDPQASVSTAFFEFSQTFTRVSIKQLDYDLEISIAR